MTDKKNLMKYAIYYLSKFSSSKANLERILKNKIRRLKIEKQDKYLLYNSIEEIIKRLEKNNFINDLRYASSKIQNFVFQGKSKIFIKNYFRQKGIENIIIIKILEDYELQNPNWELESARVKKKKKRISSKLKEKEKNLSKFSRAGFNYEISIKILEEI